MTPKQLLTQTEETLKAFSLLNHHYMVQYRTLINGNWSKWSLLEKHTMEDLLKDTSIRDLQFSFNPNN